ncbi:MAG: PEP-CTERM sorting domain-containing protein [Acidobacteriota bacterium]
MLTKEFALLLAMAACFAGHANAVTITSPFTAGLEEWTAIDTIGGTPTHIAAGGNPGGYLYIDNAEVAWAYVIAPAAFLGNLSAFDGGTLSFDGNQLTGDGAYVHANDYGHVIISGPGGSATRDLAAAPVPLGQWISYSAPLDAASWGVSALTWSAILADVTDIRVSLEGTFGAETNGFDNFTLASAPAAGIPEPSSAYLIVSGLLGAAFLRRRRGR